MRFNRRGLTQANGAPAVTSMNSGLVAKWVKSCVVQFSFYRIMPRMCLVTITLNTEHFTFSETCIVIHTWYKWEWPTSCTRFSLIYSHCCLSLAQFFFGIFVLIYLFCLLGSGKLYILWIMHRVTYTWEWPTSCTLFPIHLFQ